MDIRRCITPILGCCLLLSGCMSSGDIYVSVPLAEGGPLRVLMSGNGSKPVKNDDVQILMSGFAPPDGSKTITYDFEFKVLKPREVRRVTIDDLAGEKPIRLIDDMSPKLTNGRWSGTITGLTLDDPRIEWVSTISNSIRVYRFKIEFSDGQTTELLQPSVVPAFLKQAIRGVLGATY